MKSLLLVALLLPLLLRPVSVRAQVFGQEAAVFLFLASDLLADPGRDRVYATVPATGCVAVINTKRLKVVAMIPVGRKPQSMSMSPDGRTLYVANSGKKNAVGTVDLKTLTQGPSISLPAGIREVVCGLDGRLYVSSKHGLLGVIQIDTVTGAILPNISDVRLVTQARLQISPDRRTLYVQGSHTESYDVSTPEPALLLENTLGGTYVAPNASRLSHNGQLYAQPLPLLEGYGDTDPWGVFGTSESLTHPYAILPTTDRAFEGPVAFSADDKTLYETEFGGASYLASFNMRSFARTAEVPLFSSTREHGFSRQTIVADRSGTYLFVAQGDTDGEVAVVRTGKGSLAVPSSGSTVDISSSDSGQAHHLGDTIHLIFTRTGGDRSLPLVVYYKLGGTAIRDTDYLVQDGDGYYLEPSPPTWVTIAPNTASFDLAVMAITSGYPASQGSVATADFILAEHPAY